MKKTILIFVLLIVIIFLLTYIMNFGNSNFELSPNSTDWANFAIFFGLAVSILNLIIFYYLTMELHKYNLNKDLEDAQPIISFHLKDGDPFYTLENIGRSAAIGLKIKRNFKQEKNVWEEGYNYFTISPGERIKLQWTNLSMELGAVYKNRHGNDFYSYMDGNNLRYFDAKNDDFEELRNMVIKDIEGEYKNPPKFNKEPFMG